MIKGLIKPGSPKKKDFLEVAKKVVLYGCSSCLDDEERCFRAGCTLLKLDKIYSLAEDWKLSALSNMTGESWCAKSRTVKAHPNGHERLDFFLA